ncbi:MAG: hypothetical protein RJB10_1488 [Pseudomonadota bacterium]
MDRKSQQGFTLVELAIVLVIIGLILGAAFKAAMALYSELNAKNPEWKKIYADYSKFRADANTWFRFTEAGFDDFMQQQKL